MMHLLCNSIICVTLNPFSYGLFQYCVLVCQLIHAGGSEANYFYIQTQNPKNEPSSISTLYLRVRISFNLIVGTNYFNQNSGKNSKEFLTRDFEIAAKKFPVQVMRFCQMKRNWKRLKVEICGTLLQRNLEEFPEVSPNN